MIRAAEDDAAGVGEDGRLLGGVHGEVGESAVDQSGKAGPDQPVDLTGDGKGGCRCRPGR
jgi:hypothetical protein